MSLINDPFTFNSLSDFFDTIFTDPFDNNSNLLEAYNSTAPKIRKDVCSTSFPPSSMAIDDKTKELHIMVALAGLNENDISLDYNNDYLTLKVSKQKEDNDRAFYYKGLRLIEDGEVKWRINRGKFDMDKTTVSFKDGLLEVVIPPTEAAKPKQKKLFGNLNPKALEETSKEEDNKDKENE